ncbi:16S rRNA (guanine(527)-N(7))-methyltransferase RsmG [Treponema rectale]|uniref:Ribosomal RNA small subunit methyltransferase G n=1 Tax=Treponema rectale TaxID=744512 RepID=A0A840S8V7_9SPIR|nr:16S rRNA (guanine(527)-N(7))-methyltransferase RsmG [Treponema rectale]MBB5219099.1 16S rRNA (guanine527-N7)-methyltransferase [Treponema rectale]QOS40999.1 16S rRNA (guanine(527)-N(7))-methyltransferase RsmG [Treponema rectale]
MNEKLMQGCAKLGLNLSQVQFDQLETYINAVLDFNKTYNLMKADNADELAVNHVLDSLAAVPHIASLIKPESKIGDIGSGGGCPGIPLAVAFPENSFTLVERMEKRCVFLESAVRKMNLKNVKVLCSQADSVEKEIFDLEVFRAFHPFDKKIVKLLFGMLKKGGHLAAYKARLEKINAEMAEVQVMVPDYKVINLTVPFLEDHERNLVVIQK